MTHGMLLVAALMVSEPDRQAKEPTYKVVEVQKAEDTVVPLKEKDRTVFVITSKTGIGDASIVLASGEWPQNVTLRFQYAKGRGFDMLEDIRMYSDHLLI